MSTLRIEVEEGGSKTYHCTLQDDAGDPIPLAAITSLTATLYDVVTDTIINSRDAQDVKNANGGTVDATSGAFALDLLAADNPIKTATSTKEQHKLLLELVLTNGKTRNWQRKVIVTNLHRVP